VIVRLAIATSLQAHPSAREPLVPGLAQLGPGSRGSLAVQSAGSLEGRVPGSSMARPAVCLRVPSAASPSACSPSRASSAAVGFVFHRFRCALDLVGRVTDGVLDLSGGVLPLAFGLAILVAGDLALELLGFANDLVLFSGHVWSSLEESLSLAQQPRGFDVIVTLSFLK